jgi:hypothetical protein
MNVVIGTVAAQFLFWEYLFRISGIVSLQCIKLERFRESQKEDERGPLSVFIPR